MIDINELRRLAQAATSGGWYVERGKYVYGCKDVTDGEEEWHPVIACTDDDETNVNFEGNAAFIAASNPTTILELLDRLEAAEKECDELRAKIAEMEKQEPVAFGLYSGWALKATYLKEHEACEQRDRRQLTADLGGSLEAYRVAPLYALPGAQPAPSVPDGWKEGVEAAARLIDQKAELYAIRFGHDDMGMLSFGTGAHAEIKMDHYTSMIELADEVRAMLAAAPEAKP